MFSMPLCFLYHALWSFKHSVDLMTDISAIEQPFYHPVPYIVSSIKKSLCLWVRANFKCLTCLLVKLASICMSFPWLRRHRMSLSDQFNLNWKLISLKISCDDMKCSFFSLRIIARSTNSIVFLTCGFRFSFSATLLCLLWRKLSL